MSEYREPIQIRPDDPICSVSALNGTVIGILFDKNGREIKKAIAERIKAIDVKIGNYEGTIREVEDFIKYKKNQVKELETLYTDRADEKKAKARPFERQIEDIQKQIQDLVFGFDKETEKKVADRAMKIEKGFEEIQGKFKEIDKLIESERFEKRMSKALRPRSFDEVEEEPERRIYSTTTTDDLNDLRSGTPSFLTSAASQLTGEENKALARLNTLKALIQDYEKKIYSIIRKIDELKEEKRRLDLISRNIQDDRIYKLDLNKLSAFGFENVVLDQKAD